LLNFFFSWWWADSVVALLMVPIIANEGLDGTKGKVFATKVSTPWRTPEPGRK